MAPRTARMPADPRYLIGRAPCGCVTFAALNDPASPHITNEVVQAMRTGLSLERRWSLPARGYLGPGCPACRRVTRP